MSTPKIGRWAFIIGIIIAILLGFASFAYSALILVILGLIVGLINISDKETDSYLIAVIALLTIGVACLQVFTILGSTVNLWVQAVLTNFLAFVGASGLIVAIKSVLSMSRD